jgi:hypothetical protein
MNEAREPAAAERQDARYDRNYSRLKDTVYTVRRCQLHAVIQPDDTPHGCC